MTAVWAGLLLLIFPPGSQNSGTCWAKDWRRRCLCRGRNRPNQDLPLFGIVPQKGRDAFLISKLDGLAEVDAGDHFMHFLWANSEG